jgi:tetratricopeptide (TPR) repeat protein
MFKSSCRYFWLFAACMFLSALSGAQVPPQSSAANGASVVRRELARLIANGQCKPQLPQSTGAAANKDFELKAGVAAVRCAISSNQPDLAVDILRILNRDFPLDSQVLYLSVHAYSDLSALAAQNLITSAPRSLELLELEAESLEMEGKLEQAEEKYHALLQQNRHFLDIHYRLGKLLLLRPNPSPLVVEEAKREFEQELEIDSSHAGSEYFLGDLARRENQWPEAIDHFSRATKLDPTLADAYLGLGWSLVTMKRFADAIEPLKTAVKLHPLDPVARYNLAVAYGRTGRRQDAEREFAVHRELTENRASSPAGAQNGVDNSKILLH